MKRRPELFVESSALVAWALWEERGREVATCLRTARVPWVSAIAVPECLRALLRALAESRLDAIYVRGARRRLLALFGGCRVVPVDDEILERVGHRFPVEPIRTLDAIHLASLERARSASTNLTLLSLDLRVRANAERLGMPILP